MVSELRNLLSVSVCEGGVIGIRASGVGVVGGGAMGTSCTRDGDDGGGSCNKGRDAAGISCIGNGGDLTTVVTISSDTNSGCATCSWLEPVMGSVVVPGDSFITDMAGEGSRESLMRNLTDRRRGLFR